MDEKTKKDKLSEIFESDLLGLLAVDEPKNPPYHHRIVGSLIAFKKYPISMKQIRDALNSVMI